MGEFVKDYVQLCKDSGRFYKKHWKGMTVMNAVVIGAEMAWFYRDQIKDTLEDKFGKKEDQGLD